MRNRFRIFLIALLIGAVAPCLLSCQSGKPVGKASPTSSAGASDTKQRPADNRYIDPIFDEVTVTKDIPYGTAVDYKGQELTLLLDIYSPAGDTDTNRPAIFWVHGGGFTSGAKDGDMEFNLGEAFALKGYVFISINYRLRKSRDDWTGTLTDAVTDTTSALQWIVQHSQDYGVDPEHIAVGGHSAGGIIATALCYHRQILPSLSAETAVQDAVFGVINMSGGAYGLGDINPGAPPCLIIHGSEDDTVPFMGAAQCSETLTDAGVKNTFYVLDGVSHDLNPCIREVEDVVTVFLCEELTGIKPNIPIHK